MDAFYKQNTLPDALAKPQEVALPDKVGPYKIEALLNQGGMSLLYLGIDPTSKKPLAIKVLSPKFVTNPEMMQQFIQEASIIKMTSHPNIVKLYGQGEWEGGLYIAMELIRGISLRQFILQHSLSLKRSLDIILQVAYALCHLHTHGVIHGDLKPENILIEEDGEVKVLDFGIARLHDTLSEIKSAQFAGTPNYMSPEHKEGSKKLSFLSDIYSLGVIAYELILGRLSFGIINLSLIPKGLRGIIEKCLAVSTAERYQDIVDFITAISQYLKSGEINKDKSGRDETKEIIEEIFEASQSFVTPLTFEWPHAEIGMAKTLFPMAHTLFFKIWKLSNNTLLAILASGQHRTIEGSFQIAELSGLCEGLLLPYTGSSQSTIQPQEFLQTLNRLLGKEKGLFDLSLLHLNPLKDLLTYIPCGQNSLIHVPQGTKSLRVLQTSNPPLGKDPSSDFSSITDNWNSGDVIVMSYLSKADKKLKAELHQTLEDSLFYSSQTQAENLIKKANTSDKSAKLFLTIERIV